MKPEWNGHPGHFIGAASCRFHLNTRVGRYRISTVGDYFPPGHPEGESARPIGAGDRTHETMVFPVDSEGRVTEWSELESASYTDCDEASRGHMRLVEKYLLMETAR